MFGPPIDYEVVYMKRKISSKLTAIKISQGISREYLTEIHINFHHRNTNREIRNLIFKIISSTFRTQRGMCLALYL
jgi:hypothetical protein